MPGKQIQVVAPGQDLKVVEVDTLPECPPKGLVIKTLSCGICYSDVHLWEDNWQVQEGFNLSAKKMCDQVNWPMILGHEICGEVVSLGPEVYESSYPLEVGDLVAVYPWAGCGECGVCQQGSSNICPRGGMRTNIGLGAVPGGYQSHVALRERRLAVRLPDSISPDVACLFGCSTLTAYNACRRIQPSIERASPAGGAKLLVVGAGGGLGLWCLQLARALFPSNTTIYVVETTEEKLTLTKSYGADEDILWTSSADYTSMIQKILDITGGGVDACVDFVSSTSTVNATSQTLKSGAILALAGLHGGVLKTPLLKMVLRDVTICGIATGTRKQLEEVIALYSDKNLKPPPVKVVQPEGANEALQQLQQGVVTGRTVICFK